MTTEERDCRNARMIRNIQTVLRVHHGLRPYASRIVVSIENGAIILQGQLPTSELRSQLIPAIRQAGVLCQVSNLVCVDSPVLGTEGQAMIENPLSGVIPIASQPRSAQ